MNTSPTVRRVLRTACHVLPIVVPGTPLSEVITRVVGGEIIAPGLARDVAAADSMAAIVAQLRIGVARDPDKIINSWAANRHPREVRRVLAELAGDHDVVRQLCDEHDAEMADTERVLDQMAARLERGASDER